MHSHSFSTYSLLLLVIAPVWIVSGCRGDATVSADDVPLHHHLVCASRTDGQTEPCGGDSERLAFFNTWVKEAISLPQSTFSIWAVGPVRDEYRHIFTACTPEHWPASVFKAKANFIMRSQQAVRGTQQGLVEPDNCHPPEPQSPGIHQLTVSPTAAPLTADVLDKLVFPSGEPRLHYGVACDRSDSTQGITCTPEALLRVFDHWVAEALVQPGASLSVEMVGPLQDALNAVYHVTVPDVSVGQRVAFILGARTELAHLLDGSKEYGSTIAEAISAAVRRLRERQGRYQLVVLSDLLQLTAGEWNFGGAVPTPDDFLAWLKSTQLIADLRDIPVLACGVHTGHFGTSSAVHAMKVQEVWQAAFAAMGASEVNLYSSCEAGFAALKPGRIASWVP